MASREAASPEALPHGAAPGGAAPAGATPDAARLAAQAELDRLWARGTTFLGCRYALMGGAMSWVSERIWSPPFPTPAGSA